MFLGDWGSASTSNETHQFRLAGSGGFSAYVYTYALLASSYFLFIICFFVFFMVSYNGMTTEEIIMTLIQFADLSKTIDIKWNSLSSSTVLSDALNFFCNEWHIEDITISGQPICEDQLHWSVSELPLQRLPQGKFYVQIEKHR